MNIKIWIVILGLMGGFANADIRYKVTDLSELAENADIVPSVGYCINENGDIAGHGIPAGTDPNLSSKVFLYDATSGTFINLGNLAGNFTDGKGGNGYGINNSQQVVGRNSISNSLWNYRPFLFSDSNYNNDIDTGEMVNLTYEEDLDYGWADAINDVGQVIGFSYDSDDDSVGWVWQDLDEDGVAESGEKQYFGDYSPNAINDAGDIALVEGSYGYLWSDLNANGIYDSNELQTMPIPEGYLDEKLQYFVTITDISPVAISNDKAICGAAENFYGKANGFYWSDENGNGIVETDEYELFGSLLLQTHLRAMNNNSEIVGGTYEYDYAPNPQKNNRSAFIWTLSEGMINLNDVVGDYTGASGPRWFSQAEGINDEGQIVVSGWYDNNGDETRNTGEEHVFVLTPYPTGDINLDGCVNLKDISIVAQYYGNSSSVYPDADISGNSQIDFADLILMAEYWAVTINE